jgi:hypothetical protein
MALLLAHGIERTPVAFGRLSEHGSIARLLADIVAVNERDCVAAVRNQNRIGLFTALLTPAPKPCTVTVAAFGKACRKAAL